MASRTCLVCLGFVICVGLCLGVEAQLEKEQATLVETVSRVTSPLLKTEKLYRTSYAGYRYPLVDDRYKKEEECCHLQKYTASVTVKGITCSIPTTKCVGGCRQYSNETSLVVLQNDAGTYIATASPEDNFFEGAKCCGPTGRAFRYQACNGATVRIEHPLECDCGPCDDNVGKCYLRANIQQHTIHVSKYYSCKSVQEVNIPECTGACSGAHVYAYGTVWGHGDIPFCHEKQSASCCRGTGQLMEKVLMRCTYRWFSYTYTWDTKTTLTKISGCACQKCGRKEPSCPNRRR